GKNVGACSRDFCGRGAEARLSIGERGVERDFFRFLFECEGREFCFSRAYAGRGAASRTKRDGYTDDGCPVIRLFEPSNAGLPLDIGRASGACQLYARFAKTRFIREPA